MKNIQTLVIIIFTFIVVAHVSSCGGETENLFDDQGDYNPQNKVLVGSKWTSRSWDYDIADDGEWAYIFDEVYNVYFYSQSEGVAYYSRRTLDSDEGKSRIRYVCFFEYNVDGNDVEINTITNSFPEFKYFYKLNHGQLECQGYDLTQGVINNDDYGWLNTITGTSGECKWYYDYDGSLTITGDGEMANYKSYNSTPWGDKYHAVHSVNILDGVTSVGTYAFASPTIGEVEFPYSGLIKVGAHAFEDCCARKLMLGNDVKYVDDCAFCSCKYASVSIPKEVEEIGEMACYDCKSAYLGLTEQLRKVGSHAFGGKCKTSSWTKSEVLEVVGMGAFTDIDVKEISLPAIKELGHLAFNGVNINKINIGASLTKVAGTPFYCASTGTLSVDSKTPLKLERDIMDGEYVKNWVLKVPEGSEKEYKNADYWRNFKTINGSEPGTGTGSGDIKLSISSSIIDIFSATISASIKGVNKSVNVGFIYNQSPNFDKVLSEKVSTKSQDDFSLEIKGLHENRTYYYCAYAEVDGHSYYGDVRSFKTKDSKCPDKLSYKIDGKNYDMILVKNGPDGDFYMMQTELPPSSSIEIGGFIIQPVVRGKYNAVIRANMQDFLDDIRSITGIAFRMPTKKEWQYAAAGGHKNGNYKYSGSDNIEDVAWYKGNSQKRPHDICEKSANELGLYDMSGNYAEVTNDNKENISFVDGYICGGSWNDNASSCTVTSSKEGIVSGNISGTPLKEKNAFDAKYNTIRLVYSKK